MKNKDIAFAIALFAAAVLVTIRVREHQDSLQEMSNIHKQKADYYEQQSDSLQCRIHEWEHHATRMKRIMGVPDSVEWNYATKCKYQLPK